MMPRSPGQAAAMDFRARLAAGEPLLGSFCIEFPSSAVPEALSHAGFDFGIVDTEHSAFGVDQVAALVTGCRAAAIACVVRVPKADRMAITRTADMVPDGLIFPGVASADEARSIVDAARYAPLGSRGVAPMVAHSRVAASDRYETLDRQLALIMQIEGAGALDAAPEIAAVEGVDAVFVGTYDLSHSLGVPGQIDHPSVFAAGQRIRRELAAGTAIGVYVQSGEMANRWLDAGATLIAYGTDGQLFLSACRSAASSVDRTARRGGAR